MRGSRSHRSPSTVSVARPSPRVRPRVAIAMGRPRRAASSTKRKPDPTASDEPSTTSERAVEPLLHDRQDLVCCRTVRQQVIAPEHRIKTLGLPSRGEDALALLDTDDLVVDRMDDQERPVEFSNPALGIVLLEVVEELLRNRERASTDGDNRLAIPTDGLLVLDEEPPDVGRISRCTENYHGPYRSKTVGGHQRRRFAKAVAKHAARTVAALNESRCSSGEVSYVVRQCGLGEAASTGAQPGEVKT